MGKTRDLFKKIRDTKETFNAIKDKNNMDLTEAEDIEKGVRIHRRTIQKDLNDPNNHSGVITHVKPDILE